MRRVVNSSSFWGLALLLLSALALKSGPASAFNLEGSTINSELVLPDADGELTKLNPNEEDTKEHFNLANCLCPDVQFGVEYTVTNGPASYSESAPVDVWAGTSCDAAPDNINVRDDNCVEVGGFSDVDALLSRELLAVAVGDLLAPNSNVCSFDTGVRSVYTMIDRGSPGILDPSPTEVGADYVAPLLDITIDTEPPPLPDSASASGSENAIQVKWDLPNVRAEDIRFFQVLCARADGSVNPDDGFGSIDPEYLTTLMACEQDLDGSHPGGGGLPEGPTADAGPGDPDAGAQPDAGAAPIDMPISLFNLDPDTICGKASGTENGVRIEGLTNGVDYRLVLLSIDAHRNLSAVDLGTQRPNPVEDAWEHYKESGGQADGGYCFVATATYGNYDHPFVRILRDFRDNTLAHSAWGRDFIQWYYANSPELAAFIEAHTSARILSYLLLAPLVGFAAIWEYTGPLSKLILLLGLVALFMHRRLRTLEATRDPEAEAEPRSPGKRALVVATGILLLVGLSATAHAQPYWDELNEPLEDGTAIPHWNLEIKAGPYFPSVDDEFAAEMGPFEEVFGDKWKIMGIISLDRYFAFPLGQLGVTASIGYSSRKASAFALGPDGRPFENADGELVRAPSDKTAFRLFPTSLGGVYRFTMLDDEFGVPVVPYGKLSLAYYLWNFTDPSGDTSESRTPACPNAGDEAADCEGNLARGGSLGYQATIGIAIRAERIDPDAETSLRTEMGIEHAGFFIEGTLASVDGFGADDKLSVGDTTWFGGVNFEF